MKDYKLRDSHASHTLGWETCLLLWIDEAKTNTKPIYKCRCNERLKKIVVVYYESIKRKLKTKYIWGVGVMKDYNLTLRNLRASHTLSWSKKYMGNFFNRCFFLVVYFQQYKKRAKAKGKKKCHTETMCFFPLFFFAVGRLWLLSRKLAGYFTKEYNPSPSREGDIIANMGRGSGLGGGLGGRGSANSVFLIVHFS